MKYFDKFVSNTLAGSGSQGFYPADENVISKCRTFYKVFCGGEYNYSCLFSNILDSTFADGLQSHKNMVLDEWYIHDAFVGITDFCDENSFNEPQGMIRLTFDSLNSKIVHPGEFFTTDPIKINAQKGEYICIELTYSGKQIPKHEESIIPSFVYEDGKWIPSRDHPFLSMLGCDRIVKTRIGFIGDSITQGIGSSFNSYNHWCSVVAEILGDDYSYWNLGLGYARADDAASDGAWLFKAKQCDIVFVCLGVNDLGRGFTSDQIKYNLNTIVGTLKAAGCIVVLQTIPPFDYQGYKIELWNDINDYIKNTLSQKVDHLFDCVEVLRKSPSEPHLTKYGAHPDDAGCRLWGEALVESVKNLPFIN